ncbi:MAG: ABC transporter substrate binding protein [Bordetella sp.]|nr:ABC transporter substrate binding protein [Pseudomonadota bacterium]
MRFPLLPAACRALSCPWRLVAAAPLAVLLAAALALPARAAGWTVLTADDAPAHAEFVRELQGGADADPRIEWVRIAPGTAAPPPAPEAVAQADEDRVTAGVRTRGIRRSAPAVDAVTVAVGPAAARAALDRPGQEPLLLAMLSRLDYEGLKPLPALRRGERPIGVLLREPAMGDQLALIDAVLPGKRRLGLVVTGESEPVLRELQRVAQDWQLQVEYAPDARSLGAALRAVVPRSDALIVLPDLIGENQAATLAVLRAGAGAGLPVFGSNEGMVRSGGLAAAVSTPAQLARQARAMGARLAGGSTAAPVVESATPASVRVNATVARGLNLRLPPEQDLAQRVTAPR